MTEERYVYTQDQRERKSAATGARAKKGGSRSKRCTLPSDHLTPAQKRKLNGQPEAINLNRPMTFTELKQISPTLQFLYLDHLVNVHKARRVDLVEMLGIAPMTMQRLIKALPGKLDFIGKRKHQAPEWIAFRERAAQEAAQAPEADTQAPKLLPRWSRRTRHRPRWGRTRRSLPEASQSGARPARLPKRSCA